jgi:hypothetical protein
MAAVPGGGIIPSGLGLTETVEIFNTYKLYKICMLKEWRLNSQG